MADITYDILVDIPWRCARLGSRLSADDMAQLDSSLAHRRVAA